LEPIDKRRPAQVGTPYVTGVEAGLSVKEPCFRVQVRCSRIVIDSHLGAELVDETVEGSALSRTNVCCCQDTNRHFPFPQTLKSPFQHRNSAPLDEGAQQINTVRALHLQPQL